ncbi:MAG: 2-oxo acid dehydrogenase subunit E2 [Anaerolineae bacterium]|nr:2-oxo acid dehydrogenase subunit E2 [Phycisphaerae bacterium]
MPQLSDTMTEGTVVKWLKKEGDKVKEGEIIAEVETDKATMEWEATDSGTLAVIVAKEGDKVKVGGAIAVLATGSEDPKTVKSEYQSKPRAEARGSSTAEPASAPQGASTSDAETAGVDPIADGRAQSRQELTQTQPTETSEQLSRSATAVAEMPRGGSGNGHGPQDRVRVSPLARRLAEERGVDLTQLTGSGPGGRIVQNDVIAFAEGKKSQPTTGTPMTSAVGQSAKPSAPAVQPPQRVASGEKQVIPLNKMRQTIALRLQQSKQQIPHFYETIDADVESISNVREKLNQQLESQKIRLSISDFVNKAIVSALTLHPAVNAHFNAQKNEITRFGDVNLGIAVAVPDGLIVPVLRNADQMGLKEIRQRSADLADRARAGKLKQDEMTGATFSVSTLGAYGIREFSAIINPPEVGILAIGAAEKRAVVRDDQVVPRTMMSLTLSVDHRAVDGATAADFMRTLKSMLEEPGMMLA